MTFVQAQQTWTANSEFFADGDVLEEGDVRSGAQTGVTSVNLFQGVLADPNCSGIEVLSCDVYFEVTGTHDGTNNHDITLRLVGSAAELIQEITVNTGTDFSNITAANSPLSLQIPPATINFTANSARIQLRYDETGTAPISNPSVFIRYRKVFGSNPAIGGATPAA